MDEQPLHWSVGVFVCVGFILSFLVGALLFRKIVGCQCICGKRMKFFKELPDEEKREILRHFEQVEKRHPDESGIFACPACLRVYDDFSGEKKSLDADNVLMCKVCGYELGKWPVTYLGNCLGLPHFAPGYQEFVDRNAALVDQIECLRCQRHPADVTNCILCDSPTKVYGCPHCFTLYKWVRIGNEKYEFLVALTTQEILKEAVDPTLGYL